MGSPPFSRTSRQRQPGGGEAPARAGAQQARSPEHGLERGGVTTPPQPREGSGISRSPQSTTQSPQPTTSQSRPPALHRIPDSPKQQQPLRRRRNDEVARARGRDGSFRRFRFRCCPSPSQYSSSCRPDAPLRATQTPAAAAACRRYPRGRRSQTTPPLLDSWYSLWTRHPSRSPLLEWRITYLYFLPRAVKL